VKQTRAVFEAMCGRISGFERTPKTGCLKEGRSAGRSSYSVEIRRRAWLEKLACAWLSFAVFQAISLGAYHATPLLLLFAVGFAMTGFGGLKPAGTSAVFSTRKDQAEAA